MTRQTPKKTLDMQPSLFNAAIDVLNGLSLMEAFRRYGNSIKLEKTNSDFAAYGVIRHSVMRVCAHRNKRKFEELRDRDANKPKSGKKSASDVSYETLQLNAHHFLTPEEMQRFENDIPDEIERIDLLTETKEQYLLQQQRVMTSRLRRIERSVRETGIARDSVLIEMQTLLERLAFTDARLREHAENIKKVVAMTKAGKRHQAAVKSAEFEARKSG